jgi:uncharacterized membrane protein YfcA
MSHEAPQNRTSNSGRSSSNGFMISSEIVVIIAIGALLSYYHFDFRGPSNSWLFILPLIGAGLSLLDSSMGMGFGTIGSPLLIILGFSSKEVVPSVLIAQASLAIVAAAFHQSKKNVDYFNPNGNDLGIEVRLIAFGLIGTMIASFVYVQLSKEYLNIYVGLLVIAMSALLIMRPKTSFSWSKVNLLSLLSGFNKAISGGGYGPVATTGLILSGNPVKNSVGATLFSVIFINITAFIIYVFTKEISAVELPVFLTIGALIGSQMGPSITGKMGSHKAKSIFACIVMVLGVMTIIMTYVK